MDSTDVPLGNTVLLTCVAYGDQPLNISWSREGSVLMNDSQRITIYEEEVEEGGITFIQSILQICSTEADDAGVYSCNVDNEAGNDTANFELTVTPLKGVCKFDTIVLWIAWNRNRCSCYLMLVEPLLTDILYSEHLVKSDKMCGPD